MSLNRMLSPWRSGAQGQHHRGLFIATLLVGMSGCGAADSTGDGAIAEAPAPAADIHSTRTQDAMVPPPRHDHPRADRIASQELVDEALQPAEAASRRGVPGFAQLVIAGQMAGEICWKDPPPEITAMEGTTESGVTITVVRVAFSAAELTAAMNRAYSSSSEDLPQTVELRPNNAYDGIEIGFLPETYHALDEQAVAERYQDIVGMPVAIYMTEGATDT